MLTATSSRRTFLRRSALGAAGTLVLSRSRLAFAYEANDKLNIAGIGVGGMGRGDLDILAAVGQNLVALCDVDLARAGDTFAKYPQAKRYRDFRRMLDEMNKGIDAVVVATPDHTHAVAAVAAMQHGKHVYCEKPLARTVQEARVMREVAGRTRVATQMGNQGSASEGLRRAVDWIWAGVIGEVREVHVWFDGGNGGQLRPRETPPIPDTLDWDLWLGPAEHRPYHPSYLPESWRSWRAFGSGIVGDFGCHTANLMFRALRLEQLWNFPAGQAPSRSVIRITAQSAEGNEEGYPRASQTVVEFPARGASPPVQVRLYAQEKPDAALLHGYPRSAWGDLLIGSKGSVLSECPWNTNFVLLPENDFAGFKGPPLTLPKVATHQQEWVAACRGEGKTFSPFEMGGPLTEIMQLANIASLVPGTLEYDTVSGRVLNSDRANQLLHRPYRSGWSLA